MSSQNQTTPQALAGLNAAGLLGVGLEMAGEQIREVPTAEELGALLPDYEVKEICGRGGMGVVYRAVQRKLGREVAIKIVPVELGDMPGFAERFRREAMTTAGLAHVGIVAVHDAGETVAGHHFYVMDFVDGEDLAQRMARGRLPQEESIPLLEDVCCAVEAAHAAGIIHRDIKPSNILLTKEGKPKLADFGLALLAEKHFEYSRLTLGGTTLGTLEYAAPEQLSGAGASPASDLYSLGVLTYELLTGELPRGVFDPPSARNPDIDPAFDGVVLRALQSDPERRHESVAEFRGALLNAADRRAQEKLRREAARRKLRRRTILATAAAAIAALTVGLAFLAWQQRQRAVAGEADAQRQRDAAHLSRGEAEKLVEYMLGELQGRLFEVNRLDVLDEIVVRVDAYYASIPADEIPNDDFLRRKSEFIELRGSMAGKRGRSDEALARYREAQAIRKGLLDRHPKETDFLNTYAEGEFALADALADPQEAWQAHENIIHAFERYAEAPAEDLAEQIPLMSRARQAELLDKMQRHDEAEAVATSQIKKLDELLANPRIGEAFAFQNVRAILLRVLAAAATRKGDLAGRAEFDRQRMEIYERFLPASGRHGYREEMLAEAAATAARSLLNAGRFADSASSAEIAWAVAGRLATDDGGSSFVRLWRDDATAVWQAARKTLQQPDDPAALSAAAADWWIRRADAEGEKEPALWKRLLAEPESDGAQFAWAMASEETGKRLESTGGFPAAIDHYQRQVSRLEPRLAAAPSDSWWALGASYTYNRLGDACERSGSLTDAESAYRHAFDLRLRLLKAHPERPREARNLVSSAAHLASVQHAQQRSADSAELWLQIIPVLKPLPSDPATEWRALLADKAAETVSSLDPAAAKKLASVIREFLLAPGESALSDTEARSLSALDQAGHRR